MDLNVRDILRTGDICEIKRIFGIEHKMEFGETFAIYIEGKLYEALENDTIFEVENFEDIIVRILRPIKMENALDFWRYAFGNNWRAFTDDNLKMFKTVYIEDKPSGLSLKTLKDDFSCKDERVVDCVKHIVESNPTFNLRLLWNLLNSSI